MAKDLHLYIGEGTNQSSVSFEREGKDWQEVRSQIIFAMNTGKGTIEVPRSGQGRLVYVYSPNLPIHWVEEKD